MSKLTLIPWMGGKQHLCKMILPEIERCNLMYNITTYVEPCAGGARLLLNKSPHTREILNDKNHPLMVLWSVAKHSIGHEELICRLKSYPYSKSFFNKVREDMDEYRHGRLNLDMLTVAAYMYILAKQSRVAALKSFKEFPDDRRNGKAKYEYYRGLSYIRRVYYRIKDVEMRSGDYISLMREFMDYIDVLCYIDPPYFDTKAYDFNLTRKEHEELVDFLSTTSNKVILSGYDNPAYQRLVDEFGWTRKFIKNIPVPSSVHNGKCRRVYEYIWMNF